LSGQKVAYVVATFPRWSGGWLLNEVRGVAEAGVDLAIISFDRPPANLASQPEMREWSARTIYLARGTEWAAIAAGLSFLLRSPLRFLRGLRAAFRVGGRNSHRGHIMEVFHLAACIRNSGARHVHALQADYVADAAMAAAACLGLPFSFAAHARDLYTNRGRLAAKVRAARFVVTCTRYNASVMKEILSRSPGPGIDPAKVVSVYHGVDLARFNYTGATAPPTRLVSVARLREKKGFAYLLEALAILRAAGHDIRLDIYGDGDQKEIIAARAGSLGLAGEVTLHGSVDHARLPEVLARGGLFVLACMVLPDKDRDGIPNSIIEAMAAGVPVVSTAISGIPEIIRDGETGLIVPERDPEALARAIERFIADAELRHRCAREARRLVESTFSMQAGAAAMARLFAGGPPCPPEGGA